jgi:hypothetical protein
MREPATVVTRVWRVEIITGDLVEIKGGDLG